MEAYRYSYTFFMLWLIVVAVLCYGIAAGDCPSVCTVFLLCSVQVFADRTPLHRKLSRKDMWIAAGVLVTLVLYSVVSVLSEADQTSYPHVVLSSYRLYYGLALFVLYACGGFWVFRQRSANREKRDALDAAGCAK